MSTNKSEELKKAINDYVSDQAEFEKIKNKIKDTKKERLDRENKIINILKTMDNSTVTDTKSKVTFELIEKTQRRPLNSHLIRLALKDYPTKDKDGNLIISVEDILEYIDDKRNENILTLRFIEQILIEASYSKESVAKISEILICKAKKELKQGEKITVKYEFSIPSIRNYLEGSVAKDMLEKIMKLISDKRLAEPNYILSVRKNKNPPKKNIFV